MANLFPENTSFQVTDLDIINEEFDFKGSYLFDFEKGDFVKDSTGAIIKCDDKYAYVQWCNKALDTPRFRYAYSNLYGQEFDELMQNKMSTSAIELEIQRMVTETIMVHPRSSTVINFNFKWTEDKQEVAYDFEVKTINGESIIIDSTLDLR